MRLFGMSLNSSEPSGCQSGPSVNPRPSATTRQSSFEAIFASPASKRTFGMPLEVVRTERRVGDGEEVRCGGQRKIGKRAHLADADGIYRLYEAVVERSERAHRPV